MLVYLILCLFIAYALYMEWSDMSQRVVIGDTFPSPNDDKKRIVEKLYNAIKCPEREVIWRRCIIFAALSIVLFNYILSSGLPSEDVAMCELFIIAGVFYFSFSFYKYHLDDKVSRNMNDLLSSLEK